MPFASEPFTSGTGHSLSSTPYYSSYVVALVTLEKLEHRVRRRHRLVRRTEHRHVGFDARHHCRSETKDIGSERRGMAVRHVRSPSGALVGILSTHSPTSHRPDHRQIYAVRSTAQSAAKAIIQLRANSNGSDSLQSSLKLFRECWAAMGRADKLLERGG